MKENQELVNEKEGAILELKAILFNTDYKVIRSYETGIRLDEDIRQIRANARAEINLLEADVEGLKTQIETEKE